VKAFSRADQCEGYRQKARQTLEEFVGLPWAPKEFRAPARTESSQIILMLAAPLKETADAAAGTPAAASEANSEQSMSDNDDDTPGGVVTPRGAPPQNAGNQSPFRGAARSSPMASLPAAPAFPTGLGGGSVPREAPQREQEPLPVPDSTKKQRVAVVQQVLETVWQTVGDWASADTADPAENMKFIANVVDMMDSVLYPEEVKAARATQLQTLDQRRAFQR
jgi:hypothetical protein